MNRQKMVILFGRISYSQRLDLRQNGVVRFGHMRVSPNVRKECTRIRTTLRHTAPVMWLPLKRVNGSITIQIKAMKWHGTNFYRAKVWSKPVIEVDWDGNMTYRSCKVSRVQVGTWQSIFLRRLYSPRSGLVVGGVSGTRKT